MKSRGGEDEVFASFLGVGGKLTFALAQMMRLIFVSEHKRWEATQARAAATISTIYEEEEPEARDTQGYEIPDHAGQAFGMNCQGMPRLYLRPNLEPQVSIKTMILTR